MRRLTPAILAILALPLGGCMMTRMLTGDFHRVLRTTEKEFPEKDLRLHLDVPPLRAGEEAVVTLTAGHIRDGSPATGARVRFLIERLPIPGEKRILLWVDDRRAEELPGNGVYRLLLRIEEPGPYRITGLAWVGASEATGAPLTVVAVQDAVPSGTFATVWIVLGVIAMGAMMAVMFFWGGMMGGS